MLLPSEILGWEELFTVLVVKEKPEPWSGHTEATLPPACHTSLGHPQ